MNKRRHFFFFFFFFFERKKLPFLYLCQTDTKNFGFSNVRRSEPVGRAQYRRGITWGSHKRPDYRLKNFQSHKANPQKVIIPPRLDLETFTLPLRWSRLARKERIKEKHDLIRDVFGFVLVEDVDNELRCEDFLGRRSTKLKRIFCRRLSQNKKVILRV